MRPEQSQRLSRFFAAAVLLAGLLALGFGLAGFTPLVPLTRMRLGPELVIYAGVVLCGGGALLAFLPFRFGLASSLFVYGCGLVFAVSYRPPTVGDWSYKSSGKKTVFHSEKELCESYSKADPVLGDRGIPNNSARQYNRDFDVTYHFGPDGYRVMPRPQEPPPHPLVLFLGCSFTFGQGVEDEETFSAILAREAWTRCQVSNRSLPGWGTVQACLLLEEALAAGERPAAVLYGFYPHHAVRNHRRKSWHQQRNVKFPLFDVDQQRFRLAELAEADHEDGPAQDAVEREITHALLRRMRDLCRSQDIPFFVLSLRHDDTDLTRGIRRMEGLDVIDLADAAASLFPHDGHPDRLSHRAIARQIAGDPRLKHFASGSTGIGWKSIDPERFQLRMVFGDKSIDANLNELDSAAPGVRLDEIRSPSRKAADVSLWKWCAPLIRGTQYELSFDARSDQPRTMEVSVCQRGQPEVNLGLMKELTLQTEPTKHRFRWVAPTTDEAPMFVFAAGADDAAVEIASVSLEKIDEGSLAEGLLPMSLTHEPTSAATINFVREGQESFYQVGSIRSPDNVDWHLQLVHRPVRMEQGRNYRLRFRARAPKSRELSISVQRAYSDYLPVGLWQRISVDEAWKDFDLPFQATATDENCMIGLFFGNSAVPFDVSDVQLVSE